MTSKINKSVSWWEVERPEGVSPPKYLLDAIGERIASSILSHYLLLNFIIRPGISQPDRERSLEHRDVERSPTSEDG